MKKAIALLSVIVMLLSLAACGKEPAQTADSTSYVDSSVIDHTGSTAEPEATGSVTESAASAVSSAASSAPSASAASSKPTVSSKPAQSASKPATTTSKPATTNNPTVGSTPAATTHYQELTYEGKKYNVKMGRNGNPYLIADKTTLPPQLQPYCYPFDVEGIRRDITDYAKTKGFTSFYKPTAKMTQEIADTQCSWHNPDGVFYIGDDEFDINNTELDEVISVRKYWAQSGVNSLAETLIGKNQGECLCLWFIPREQQPISGLYDKPYWNGQKTTGYTVYWMHGWGDEVEAYS